VYRLLSFAGITIYESLTSLDKLIGKICFEFIGLPLKTDKGYVSLSRIIVVIEEKQYV